MMLGKGLTIALALCGACAAGTLDGGSAKAQNAELRPDTPPAMQKLLADPAVRPAVALVGRGDFAGGAALLRESARRGNPSAQVMLAQMYIAGKGVPRNYSEAARLLTLVASKLQDPTFSVAMETLKELDQLVKRSGTSNEKAQVTKAELQTLLRNPSVQQFLRNEANSQFRILNCFGWVCM